LFQKYFAGLIDPFQRDNMFPEMFMIDFSILSRRDGMIIAKNMIDFHHNPEGMA
jgi:hypothetical protein